MECLVIGSRGMLGRRVVQDALARGWRVHTVARGEADFNLNLERPLDLLVLKDKIKPAIIINCAALTDIDACENDWERARAVNAEVPRVLTQLAKHWRSYFVQVSTDHFFAGDLRMRHRETDPIKLVNKYAGSKLLGEKMALAYGQSMVVRTNITGFRLDPRKNTLVEWILKVLLEKKPISGFADFYTSGMPVGALSRTLLNLASREKPVGRWNIAGSEVFSKLDFILGLAKEFGFSSELVQAAPLTSFGGVQRADSLGLDSSRIEAILGSRLPDLQETVSELHQEYRGSNAIQKFVQNQRT